jgi:nitrite reductase/ring-hydroxylating ferredoxin subunit
MARYDFPIPFGWFEVAMADDLQPGELKELHILGEHLMLWRGENGEYHLQDNFCPHLGASIGADGRVVGNEVECPFHHWRFDGAGDVAAIPYAPDAKTKACLRNYPIQQWYGIVMAWYHPGGAEPEYDLPVLDALEGPTVRGPLRHYHEADTCLQEMTENAVDYAHFVSIHGHPSGAELSEVIYDDHRMIVKTNQEFPSSKGPVPGTLNVYSWGMGCSIVEYNTLVKIMMMNVTTPLTTERTRKQFLVYYENPENDPKVDRIANAFYKEVNRQMEQDIPIWNKKVYRPRPALTAGEGPITRFRAWAKRFYANPVQDEAA